MITIIWSIIIPAFLFIISAVTGSSLIKKNQEKPFQKQKAKFRKRLIDRLLAVMCSEAALFIVLGVISEFFMFSGENHISPAIMFIAGILPFSAAIMKEFFPERKISGFLKKTAVWAAVFMTAEVVVFNGKSFDSRSIDETIALESMTVSGEAAVSGDDIIVSGMAEIFLNDVPENTNNLILDMKQEQGSGTLPFAVFLGMKDENVSVNYESVQQKYTAADKHDLNLYYEPYGKVESLRLSFGELSKPVTIHSIRAVSSIPFDFSSVRFLILLSIAALIIAVKEYRLYSVTFQSRKLSHIILTETMALLCTFSAFLFISPDEKGVEYNKESFYSNDCFAMTFDAFQKKQVYLDIEADPALDELDNVYNRSERDASGIQYSWDTAYYNGRYYCYFGAAPVLTFYYPYYKLKGLLPTINMAAAFFGVLAVYFMCRTLLAAVRLIAPRANLLLLLSSMPIALCCCGILYSMNNAGTYFLPILSGLCYLFLSLWMGLRAYSVKNKKIRLAMLFIGGASLALCVASRPGMALCSAVLIPFFIGILMDKTQKISYRAAQACSFLVPLIAGGIAVMWYNNARFGSPFDFGAAYQLTVSDVHANKLSLSGIAPMLYHYFLQVPRPRSSFPFFEQQMCYLYSYGKYVYTAGITGVFAYPMLLFGTAMMPAAFVRKGKRFAYRTTKIQRNSFIALCFIMSLIIAWMDFCLGGAINHYVFDIMPLMILGSVMCILRSVGKPEKNMHRYITALAVMAATFIIVWLLEIEIRTGNLTRHCPNLYEVVEDLLIFWQ
ncbi:MAG: hypothetical protein IJY19_01270 [Ruminococcus sp.]|nr:hypothetical protein [Ruminococcus sp.]